MPIGAPPLPDYSQQRQKDVFKLHVRHEEVTSLCESYLMTISSLHSPHCRMTDKLYIRKDLEGSGRSIIELLHRNLPGGSEENHGNSQSG
jgi:hypothetical protein